MDCSGDRVFAVELLLDTFLQTFATSHPTPRPWPPTPLATLAQNWCAPSKRRSEMASNQAGNKF